jgi:hypothetical protein
MAEFVTIIIDLAAGHAKLIGTAPRALPILQLASTKLACHLAVSLLAGMDHQDFVIAKWLTQASCPNGPSCVQNPTPLPQYNLEPASFSEKQTTFRHWFQSLAQEGSDEECVEAQLLQTRLSMLLGGYHANRLAVVGVGLGGSHFWKLACRHPGLWKRKQRLLITDVHLIVHSR